MLRKRGRLKGVKNGGGKKRKKIKIKKKRGSKLATKSGRVFQFGHNLDFMQVDWLQPASPEGGNAIKRGCKPDTMGYIHDLWE